MLTPNLLRYGKTESLPQPIPLRAGPVSLVYDEGDLRYIKYGDHELVRRIYAAVRDRNWGTIQPVFTNVRMDIEDDRFCIVYEVVNHLDDIHFTWHGLLRGESDGTVTFHMEGQAITTFMKNRIGLCVLHPASVAGNPCTVMQVSGREQQTVFPAHITPDQPPMPFTDITGLSYPVGPAQVDIAFEGGIFEMEDQRNWSDASFKTFCPPLHHPYPIEITAGTKVCQSVTIRMTMLKTQQHRKRDTGLILDLSDHRIGRLPALGTGIASHGEPLTTQEVIRLKALRLSHLRADVWLSDPPYIDYFHRAVNQSQSLGIPLFLALHLSENGEAELRGFEEVLRDIEPQVALWLVYPAREIYHGGSLTAQVVAWFNASNIARVSKYPVRLAAGTDTDFIFFLRNMPPFRQIDAVCFSINPQVHTFDNASIMETLEAQTMLVTHARKISKELPVVVSPVTLRPRHNPYASGVIPLTPPGELPPQVDYRQPSLFTAAWLVGSIRALALGGASAATYFETTGGRGLMECQAGSPISHKFYSLPGGVFPLYHILADLSDFTGGANLTDVEVLDVKSSDGLKIQGLALRNGEQIRVLIANLSPDRQSATVRGLKDNGYVRILDELNAEEAMLSPEILRSRPMETCTAINSKITFDLLPYAVATLDLSTRGFSHRKRSR